MTEYEGHSEGIKITVFKNKVDQDFISCTCTPFILVNLFLKKKKKLQRGSKAFVVVTVKTDETTTGKQTKTHNQVFPLNNNDNKH